MRRLKELRVRADLSVTEAARRLGVTRVAVHSWEAGAKRPTPVLLRKALELYEASPQELCEVAHHYALGQAHP